jgi:hypothetical protein
MAWSYYATPTILGFRPWAPDFAPNNWGEDPFPRAFFWDPDAAVQLRWQNQDWDPALRFWTLPFDPNLTEWLKDQDSSRPSIMAAREFAQVNRDGGRWRLTEDELLELGWLHDSHLGWKNGYEAQDPEDFLIVEFEQLFTMMEDDRERYLDETHAQADGLPGYVIATLGIDGERKPWTIELINTCLSIGNIAYMYYKEQFRRARPSALCPGLLPPFGPPRHPAFPSGHSFLGHLIALMLMEIPEVAHIYGEDAAGTRGVRHRVGRQATLDEVRSTTYVFNGPLLWLADRLARNRERIGVHYPSDSAASRWLAGSIWDGLMRGETDLGCPTVDRVLALAQAEWIRS